MGDLVEFDADSFVRALDQQRVRSGLVWMTVAGEMTRQSEVLRRRTADHAVCGGALTRTVARRTMSCQYALMLLRWLGRVPEDFLTGASTASGDTTLPSAGTDRRLLWDLAALHRELDERRQRECRSWADLAQELRCSPARLTNLRTARQADLHLVVRITQWLRLPGACFIHAVDR